MSRLILAIAAALCCTAGAHAQPERSPLLGTYNADNVNFYAGRLVYPAGAFHAMGVLYSTIATAATGAGTSEQVLGTYSLPAKALDLTGRRLYIRAVFHAATNGNNKTMILYFGGSSISTGVVTTSNKNIVLEMTVVKSGASTQIVTATGIVDTTPITPYVNASGADTDTAAVVIKATGTDGTDSAGDIVLDDFFVQYMN